MKKIIKRLFQSILNRLEAGVNLFFGDASEPELAIREQAQLITDFSAPVTNIWKPALTARRVNSHSARKGRITLRTLLKTKRQSLRDKALHKKSDRPTRGRLHFPA